MIATAKSIKMSGILGGLIIMLSIGLSISVVAQGDPKGKEIGRDGHYIAYASGVVHDTKSGLEWVAGPDKKIDWNKAKEWVDSLTIAGGGWRMPMMDEIEKMYQKGKGPRNICPLLKTTGWWVWSGETKDSSLAWAFGFRNGEKHWYKLDHSYFLRSFAVRSPK